MADQTQRIEVRQGINGTWQTVFYAWCSGHPGYWFGPHEGRRFAAQADLDNHNRAEHPDLLKKSIG